MTVGWRAVNAPKSDMTNAATDADRGILMTDSPSTIDPAEVARFERLAETWWDPKGPMKVLHRFNPVRLAYIRDEACRLFKRDPRSARSLEGLHDSGCRLRRRRAVGAAGEARRDGDRARSRTHQHLGRAASRGTCRPLDRLPQRDGGGRGRQGRDLRHGACHGGGGACGERAGIRRAPAQRP